MHDADDFYDYSAHTSNACPPPAVLRDLAANAGIRFNGPAPWDIQVHDRRTYRRILTQGSLGFGEAYMDGLWDCDALDELFTRLLAADVDTHLPGLARLRVLLEVLRQQLFNLQNLRRAFQVGEEHYDLGNDIFEVMLDPSMAYSCGYWAKADNLHQAQLAKLDMICRKLELRRGETLLDIGCGWGGMAQYAARHYGVEVVGITVSREQQKLAQERCQGLPVSIELTDYRQFKGQFDKIVSVGMFEHVGKKNYPHYFDSVQRLLKNNGLFLLHTIGRYRTLRYADPWVDKYIFPNGKLPSAETLCEVLNGRFLIEDWHNFGQDYDRTLMAWWHNFHNGWGDLKNNLQDNYPQRFYRMWKYYLLSCAGFFRSRQGQLWQLVLSKRNRTRVYRSVR